MNFNSGSKHFPLKLHLLCPGYPLPTHFAVSTHLAESPMMHSENVSPTLKLETTEMSPLLSAESGCSLH